LAKTAETLRVCFSVLIWLNKTVLTVLFQFYFNLETVQGARILAQHLGPH